MRKFIYPAVFYYDKGTKTYCAAIKDLALFIDGGTIEEAHENASGVLRSFVNASLKYDSDLPEPTDFEEFVNKYPKKLVMLVEYSINN